MQKILPIALSTFLGSSAVAAELAVKLEIPKLNAPEYHRPYVALWIERADQSAQEFVGNLAVWYDIKKKNNEGVKWLKDLRQWWRRGGRDLALPVDGVSGPTRAPGAHDLVFAGDRGVLAKLPAGDYSLVVEAAREVGGRELVRVPFQWNGKAGTAVTARGSDEIGAVTVQVRTGR